jgi:hypothetical protein
MLWIWDRAVPLRPKEHHYWMTHSLPFGWSVIGKPTLPDLPPSVWSRLAQWILELFPSWGIVVENDSGERMIVRQGDYRMGRFPGWRKLK